MSSWAQVEFSDSCSDIMGEFIFFHDHIMLILVFIFISVGLMLVLTLKKSSIDKHLLESQNLEGVWTFLPAWVLLQIGGPSLMILYAMEEEKEWALLVKAIGNQWYWTYEYGAHLENIFPIVYDSYMVPANNLGPEGFRLLDVDNRTVLPLWVPVKMVTTANDVLHSWAVPSLGVKADACPGRLNQMIFFLPRPGVFFGQCSEICGANHSFMPICVESVSFSGFLDWAKTQ